MLNFITLSLTPTVLIAVDKNLKVPKSFKATSKAVPSMYRYPELLKKQEEKTKEKVETVTLSTTAKVKARTDRKNKAEGGDVEMTDAAAEEKKEEDKKEEEEKKAEEAKKDVPEPDHLILQNPSRVLKDQELKIAYDQKDSRYAPVLESRFSGFVVLRDTREAQEGEKEEFYDDEERNMDAPNPDLASDLQIPAAFEFDPAIQDGTA
jgi:26S proteasome regulatory subunit N2